MTNIIIIIASIITIIISTLILIEVTPYSDNETICNIQMRVQETINRMTEMK